MPAADFEANNRAYLQAGLRWLHATLRAQAARMAPTAATSGGQVESSGDSGLRWGFGKRPRKEETLALPAPTKSSPPARRSMKRRAAIRRPR